MKLLGTRVENISGGFTSVCRPCDVGIMKPFKTRVVEQCQPWKVAEYDRLRGTGKIPITVRVEVLKWHARIWKKVPSQIV